MTHLPTSGHRRQGPRRAGAVMLAAAFAMALPLPVFAQDASESPDAELPSPELSATTEPAAQPEGIAFPVLLGGQVLDAETFGGEDWVAQFSGQDGDPAYVEGTEALVAGTGKTLSDLTVKSALYQPVVAESAVDQLLDLTASPAPEDLVVTEPAVVLGMRIADVDARDWAPEAIDLLVGDILDPGLVMRPLGTKWTLRVTDASQPGVYPRTAYLNGDTMWLVQGDGDHVWDALSQLPDADPVRASSADSLYTDIPIALGGKRRIGLYESTEPLFLPTIGERLGSGFEDWLLDLYLDAGISPAEMIGVITWWGLEAAQDGIQIEGYRLPEGAEELTQRLLQDVFLIRPPEVSVDPEAPQATEIDEVAQLFEGVEFSEEEIAGRLVTRLDYGDAQQYIFSSADTVWVVSDPVGERELVEEAIAALP